MVRFEVLRNRITSVRRGLVRARAACVCAAVPFVSGCHGPSPGPLVPGTYVLVAGDDRPLPMYVTSGEATEYVLVSGTLVLGEDGRARRVLEFRYGNPGGPWDRLWVADTGFFALRHSGARVLLAYTGPVSTRVRTDTGTIRRSTLRVRSYVDQAVFPSRVLTYSRP